MRLRIAVSMVSLALLVVAAASAEPAPSGGSIQIFVTPGKTQGAGTILVTGAIGDYGRTTRANKDGIGRAILSKGSFEVDLSALDKDANRAQPTLIDKTTCSYVFKVSGPVTIMHGTGQYAGIAGRATISETFAAIGPRYATGARKGQCNMSNNANPVAQWGTVSGTGTVAFS